jgi:hypothetical protein
MNRFELVKSGIMESLVAYLTHQEIEDDVLVPAALQPQQKKRFGKDKVIALVSPPTRKYSKTVLVRVRNFLAVFLNGEGYAGCHVPGAFLSLVTKLQQLVSRMERFCVVAAVPGGSVSGSFTSILAGALGGGAIGSAGGGASQLAKQIRLKLVSSDPSDESLPKHYQNGITVSIHAVALFAHLESFLLPRLVSATPSVGGMGTVIGATGGGEEDDIEADIDGDFDAADVAEDDEEDDSDEEEVQGHQVWIFF